MVMCGIAGLVRLDGSGVDGNSLAKMSGLMAHRGPDGEGFAALGHGNGKPGFFSREEISGSESLCRSVGFSHRRLAILDLTDAGLQPMASKDGRVWITFNGEIFNYIELREQLRGLGRAFATQTDTEVLLEAYLEWGEDCLSRFNGMWAFAIWDSGLNRIFLARDRFGIKPLYYSARGQDFAFASEPKALLGLSWVPREPDTRAVADYLVHSREDCFQWTFFKGIERLLPGHCMTIDFSECGVYAGDLRQRAWWRITEHLRQVPKDDRACGELVVDTLESAIRLRLRSDVPIGTCLSGGLDSTTLVCLARSWLTPGNQKSYSAVYGSWFREDETSFIDDTVRFTGIENFRINPSPETLLKDMKNLVHCQDEPFACTSQYAQYKVFELARSTGTIVTLDGQGADEELAGYHYFFPVHFAGLLAEGNPAVFYREFVSYLKRTGANPFTAALSTMAGFLSHRRMIRLANWYSPDRTISWVRGEVRSLAREIEEPAAEEFGDRLNRRLHQVFSVSSLPALLRYEDRNSMAFSMEARLPFMDHRLVTILFSLSARQKIRDGWTKFVLREAVRGRIPESVRVRTDKVGFATPEDNWFARKPILPYLSETFTSRLTRDRGIFDVAELCSMVNRNATGRIRAGRAIWRALNLELWFRTFMD